MIKDDLELQAKYIIIEFYTQTKIQLDLDAGKSMIIFTNNYSHIHSNSQNLIVF